MPKNTRVSRCIQRLKKRGKSESEAIAICQASTHQVYKTGKRIRKTDKKNRR